MSASSSLTMFSLSSALLLPLLSSRPIRRPLVLIKSLNARLEMRPAFADCEGLEGDEPGDLGPGEGEDGGPGRGGHGDADGGLQLRHGDQEHAQACNNVTRRYVVVWMYL